MKFIVTQAFDQALDYLTERTEPQNLPAVKRLLNEAVDKYEDGELNDATVGSLVQQLLPLVRPEARDEVEQLFKENRRLISSFLR
ncbi:MAG: hypothetical protein FWE26_05350 [Coriobacteriia bacterium]|nr:hypothetical protein [Coriobacteriia bacterium]MCL2871032.1 hypothetical protein [Coriobacteriia bacterium]